MLELNQQINWVPEHTKNGSFGKWLENVRDWAISRNRFWGAPIPVWKSDDPNYPRIDVYGSLDELEKDFGVRPSDFHRPVIDELVRPNPDDPTGKSMMRRVPEVLDCWFESGSMPFAQVHYPFENQEWFETHFPGDFIVEYVGQTRGWFYTLHVLSTALFDRPAFKNAISHGIVLGNDGQKMSKSLRNYPGYYFFTLYANASNYQASPSFASTDLLDRYILSKTREMIVAVQNDLDEFDSYLASARVREFAEVLTNWYIRRSRDRFWSGDKDAFDTLYTVLEAVFRTVAPLLPIISEEMWRGLTGGRSVHLESWPEAEEFPLDADLVRDMDAIREAASAALALRKANGLRVRLPLSNVKKVTVVRATEEVAKQFGLTKTLTVNARALGPRLGKAVQEVIQKAKSGDWKVSDGKVLVGAVELEEGEYELTLQASSSESTAAGVTSGGFVLLDLEVTEELEQEGIARDAIRHIQQARKDKGLDVSDRITLNLYADPQTISAIQKHQQFVCEETLATEFSIAEGEGDLSVGESGLIRIELAKR